MADDLSDVYAELRDLKEQVRILMSANPLKNSSVRNGQIRIIAGTIRVDGGGSLIVNGTMSVNGTSTVTGSFTVTGPWNLQGNGTISGAVTITGNVTATGTLTQNGPWNLNGVGTIAGNVTQTGNLTATGTLTQNGPWNLNGVGVIAGNVTQTGTYQVNSPGTIKVGSAMTLAPATDGGAVVFSDGSKMSNNASSIGFTKGSNSIRVGDTTAGLLAGSNSITVSASGIQINLAAIPTENTSGNPANTLSITSGGFLRRAV